MNHSTDIPRRQLTAPEHPIYPGFQPSTELLRRHTSHLHLHHTYGRTAQSKLRITEIVKYWLNLYAAHNTVHGKCDTCMQPAVLIINYYTDFRSSREKILDFWWLSDVILDFFFLFNWTLSCDITCSALIFFSDLVSFNLYWFNFM